MPKKRDWYAMIEESHIDVAPDLTIAKAQCKPFYINECTQHGVVPYRVSDNTCPLCVAEKAKQRRYGPNRQFNLARELIHQRKRKLSDDVPFEIDVNFVRNNTPTECPALGIPLSVDDGNPDTSPSIDRLDPKGGYVEGNVNIISTRANRLKNNGTAEELFKIAIWMMKQQGAEESDILEEVKWML